jgi:polyisoprenoid-binding protein YceI
VKPGVYELTESNTIVKFTVRQGFLKAHGTINRLRGQLTVADDPLTSAVTAQLDASSISTGVGLRDRHLRSKQFLHTDQYPTIEFTSRAVRQGPSGYEVSGTLTVHGQSKPVALFVDNALRTRAGATELVAATTFDRLDFGVPRNPALTGFNLMVGRAVRVLLTVTLLAMEGTTYPRASDNG